MIGLTVAQAADRACVPVAIVEDWIGQGYLIAVRSQIDGQTYVDADAVSSVSRDLRTTGAAPLVHPGLMSRPQLAQWLWARGLPVTERALRDWAQRGALPAAVPSAGRHPARYDPVVALQVAVRLREAG